MLEIPLTSDGEQVFSMTLGGTSYGFRVIYNTRLELWTMDISVSGVDIVSGVAMVRGVDILKPYNIALSNFYMINTAGNKKDAASNTLGTNVRLFQLTDEEVASVTSV